MFSPYDIPPAPPARKAAKEIIDKVHAYMRANPNSELHRHGKMFGVLVIDNGQSANDHYDYIAAFSAKLDGSYYHEGFVPPVYEMQDAPIGTDKAESQRLQRLLFAQYAFVNGRGKSKNLLDIFKDEKPIIPAEEWFEKKEKGKPKGEKLPPSGAGECCAPKLLQYALTHGLKPVALAEFWIGAPSRTEIRREGAFYAPCSGKCVPILRHMLEGIEIEREETKAKCQMPKVLYEDEWLMVVDKPSGLLSVPGKGEEASAEHLTGTKAVHRLDQDTSGLLVLAKTPEVYKELQVYFQRRDIEKRYEAVIRPIDPSQFTLCPSEGTIPLPLLSNPYDRPRQMVNKEHGKAAVTRYRIKARRADGTFLVDFYPATGRTHQLRVHAAHPEGLNAPIVGDRLYNGGHSGDDGERLMLHAAEIRFVHPVTHEDMHFVLPAPWS